jgi:hypothetical protein
MLIAFTEPSSGQRIEENESRNVDWSFRREASNLCPCHLPIGQLRNIVSLLKNKILKKYMKRCDVWNSESDSCPPLFAYQSKNSNRVSILSYPPMYQHQAIQLPPVKPGSTSSFLDLSCGVAKQKSKKKVKMAAWHPSRQQFFPGLLQVSQLRLGFVGPWRTLSACCLEVHYFGIPETPDISNLGEAPFS